MCRGVSQLVIISGNQTHHNWATGRALQSMGCCQVEETRSTPGAPTCTWPTRGIGQTGTAQALEASACGSESSPCGRHHDGRAHPQSVHHFDHGRRQNAQPWLVATGDHRYYDYIV